MPVFTKLLFAGSGHTDESVALKQALSIARNGNGQLEALVVCPEFPSALQSHSRIYEKILQDRMSAALAAARSALGMSAGDMPVAITVLQSNKPAVAMIRHALRQECDLVVKSADAADAGFAVTDMELLRKCPVPLWLCRPIERHRAQIRVAVAVDPQDQAGVARALSVSLLQQARMLADTADGALSVVACHDFGFGDFIRDTAHLFGASDVAIEPGQVESLQAQDMQAHRAQLDALVAASGIGGKIDVQHLRGRPEEAIPQFIKAQEIDILVMGTVARTGIAELLVGNTAESIVKDIPCSLLALKPEGFASPVKPV